MALVVGEAGIGKSRLVAEAQARARGAGICDLAGPLLRAGSRAAVCSAARSATRLPRYPRADEIAEALGPSAAELVTLLPELADILPDAVSSPTLAPEQEKRRCFQALTQFFIRLAARQPLLVIIEDLHWSDDTSLEWLLILARRVASASIFLVLTYRGDELHPGLAHMLASLDRERLADEIRLTALNRSRG